MKIFYTDLSKKSNKYKIGINILKVSLLLFIFGIIAIIIAISLDNINDVFIANDISIFLISLSFILVVFGVAFCLKKFNGSQDLRIFLYDDDKNLYLIDKHRVSDIHFDAFRLANQSDDSLLKILTFIGGTISSNVEKNVRIEDSRNEKDLIENLKDYKYNIIKDVEIIDDKKTSITAIIRTTDGSRKKISISDVYTDYEELFSIIRSLGGK